MRKKVLQMLVFITASVALMPLQAESYSSSDECEDACDNYTCCEVCQKQFWLEADYLYWQIQGAPKVIPLVIQQPTVGGPFDVVLGGKKTKNDWHSGGRFALGYWFDAEKSLGAEVNYFFLGKNTKHSRVTSDENGSPRLRVPFFNVLTGSAASSALATPGIFRGSAALKVSHKMQGAELNILKNMCYCAWDFVGFAGFRYWNFEDNLSFFANSPVIPVPTVYNYQDKFSTQNNFYGAQIGGCYRHCFSSFFIDVKAKIALGAMCQKSNIEGVFHTNEFTGSVQTFEGGFFALPTNIGHRKKTRFSVIPELNLNLGYQITHCVSLHVGYSVLYATEVLRASRQMSSRLNPSQSANIDFTSTPALVGEPSPKAKLRANSLWAQGVNVGVDFRF